MRNIVFPITSACALSCIFCSHKSNTSEIKVGKLNKTREEILSSAEKIRNSYVIIGESATRIYEGEPFLFSDIFKVLEILDKNGNSINITTSGSYLDYQTVRFLSSLNDVEINLSLNASDLEIRKKIMGDKNAAVAVKSPELLKKYGIKYTVSIVALDLEDDYEYIIKTANYAYLNGAEYIKIFIPGYSSVFTESRLQVDKNRLEERLSSIRDEVPLIIEPDYLSGVIKIEGILKNSPAEKAGLKYGDIITGCADLTFLSFNHAYEVLISMKDPVLKIIREDISIDIKLEKNEGISPGILLKSDISYEKILEIKELLSERGVLISSVFASEMMKSLFGKENVRVVENNFFGGNIRCNGLLTVQDVIDSLKPSEFDYIIIHSNFLDNEDCDITGRSIYEIVEKLHINVKLVD